MSNETTNGNSTITEQPITQNGVTLVAIPAKIKKGPTNGNPTLRPDLSKVEEKDLFAFIGAKRLRKIAESRVYADFNELYNESLDDESDPTSINLEKWQQLASGIGVASETLADLKERLAELSEQITELVTGETNLSMDEIKAKMTEIKPEMMDLKEAIAQKEAANAAKAAKRKATEEANKQKNVGAVTVQPA